MLTLKISQIFQEKEKFYFSLFLFFEVDDFILDQYNERHEVKLVYLGKYIEEFESDEEIRNIRTLEDKTPDFNFKRNLISTGLWENIDGMGVREIALYAGKELL